MTPDPVDLSGQYLLAIRRGESAAGFASELGTLDSEQLARLLDTDGARVAFWTNVYNGATQRALADDPGQYESRRQFFTTPLVTVAGRELSLDDVEHAILRRGYSKYTLGYLRRPVRFRDEFIRRHEPARLDARIHFALNCGAESCPPIAAYSREEIDDQLDLATRGYLDQTVEYDPDGGRPLISRFVGSGRAVVPRVMLWFRGDFVGKRGLVEFLRRYDQIPDDVSPQLAYHEWDWTFDPASYRDGEYASRTEASPE